VIEHGFDIERDLIDNSSLADRRWQNRGNEPPQDLPFEEAPESALFDVLCGGRLFHAISALLTAGTLLVCFNPKFGTVERAWFWDVVRDPGGGLALDWAPPLARGVVLVLVALALLIAALMPCSRWRGRLALSAFGVAFATFAVSRDAYDFLPVLLLGGLVGVLLYGARLGPARVRAVAVVLVGVAGYLFLPLPNGLSGTQSGGPATYDAVARSVVAGHVHADATATREGTTRAAAHLGWVRTTFVEHLLVLAFALGLLFLVGLRATFVPVTAGILGLLLVAGLTWIAYADGVATSVVSEPDAEWMSGLAGAATVWAERLAAVVLALAGGITDLAASRR
jgi:hypothetical protein